MFKKAKENKKGFTLAELLIVVAIIAVLVAISIPIFSSQLEKSREAVDLANIRAAYAEITAEYLSSGNNGDSSSTLPTNITVPVTQKTDKWQCDGSSETTTIAQNISVPSATSGNYTVAIDAAGTVTVSAN